MTQENFTKNIVIGAGIAGLSAACKLKENEEGFLIFEKNSFLGGNWESKSYKNSIYEFGPNTIIDKSETLRDLIKKADMEEELISHELKKSRRYFYRKNKFIEVSSNPFKLLSSRLLSLKGKLRITLEPFISSKSHNKESVFDFFARRLGSEFAEQLLSPALQGVWGGDIKQLNMSVAMPYFYKLEQEHSSLLKGLFSSKKKKTKTKLQTISFKNGLQDLCTKLGDFLGFNNIKLNSEIIAIEKEGDLFKLKVRRGKNQEFYYCQKLYLACEAFFASKLLAQINPSLSKALSQIYYAPMFLCTYSIKKDLFQDKQNYLDAFGFLNANKAHFTLGSIFSSQVFPERNLEDEYLFLSFLGGARNSQIVDFETKDLQKIALTEAKEIFDNALDLNIQLEDINFVDSKLIQKAIPQYNDNYQAAQETIKSELSRNQDLKLLGNYINGVSIVDTVEHASAII